MIKQRLVSNGTWIHLNNSNQVDKISFIHNTVVNDKSQIYAGGSKKRDQSAVWVFLNETEATKVVRFRSFQER